MVTRSLILRLQKPITVVHKTQRDLPDIRLDLGNIKGTQYIHNSYLLMPNTGDAPCYRLRL